MDFNSKYKSREIEAILDQVSSGQSNIFLWNWNMAASGQLGDGEFNKLKESSIVLIGAGTSDANYYVPMVRSADDDSIVLSVHTASSEGLGNLVFSFNANGAWTMETEELTFVTEEQLDEKQDKLISGTNIKTINGESILGSGDLTIEGDEDIIVANKSDLEELYKDAPEGTKAVVVNKITDVLGVNLFDFFMGTIEGVEEVFTQVEAYTLKISSVDTSVELPISDTADISVTLPFLKEIKIELGSDLASISRIHVRAGYYDLVWSEGVWMGEHYLLYNEMPVSQLLTLDDNAIAGLMAISPALTVDFVGTKTITEYVKSGDNWEVWSEGESGLNTKLNALLGKIAQLLPTQTSQLENDSNFVSSDNLKTINGESILGSGDISISGGGSSSGKEYVEAPLMTEPMGTSIMFTPSVPLEPNKVYVAKEKVSSIIAIRMSSTSDSIGAEYTIMFQTSTSEIPISLDSDIKLLWANGAIPTIEADTYYELSLVLNKINNTYIFNAVLTPFKPVE